MKVIMKLESKWVQIPELRDLKTAKQIGSKVLG